MSTSEIASRLHKSQSFVWQWLLRLGIKPRSPVDGGRLYAPKRTKNPRTPFGGSDEDKAYLQGFADGDLDVRRVSNLAIMVSSTTTHPDFTSCFETLFRSYGPVYTYPIHDRASGYKWKVAARLDNSFAFILPAERRGYPSYHDSSVFFAWLAGLVDSDGSVSIVHAGESARSSIGISNQDFGLLDYVKQGLLNAGYYPTGPYKGHPKGFATPHRNIRYKADMYHLYLQRIQDIKKALRTMPLRLGEKRQRKELILGFPVPVSWKTVGPTVKSYRRRIDIAIAEYARKAEECYKNRGAGKVGRLTGERQYAVS